MCAAHLSPFLLFDSVVITLGVLYVLMKMAKQAIKELALDKPIVHKRMD